VEMTLLPTWSPFHIYKMSSWSRAMLIPLAIINHFKPTRSLPGNKQLHELYPLGTEQSDLRLPRSERFWTWRNFFLRLNDVMKILHPLRIRPTRQRALEEAERWMLERIGEGSDGLAAVFPAMLNCLIALRVLGYPKDHPAYKKAAQDFAGLFVDDPEDFRIQPCLSPVWDTAINLISLAESGLPADDPALRRAAKWLLDKEVRIRGDWQHNNSHPEPSGWAFEYNNVYYPDVDDTAMVLMALRLAKPENDAELAKTFQRALDWQMSFQCRDGGWGAFDKNVTTPWLEDMPFADHNAILDPTCSDLTARTLELLGYINFNPKVRSVRDAIHYLIETQEPDGSWYGRWGVNYIYGTWQVLRGLRAINFDMTQDWILRGRDWLESCQNDDGGWGETCATYENPATKGIGKSTASQTAWAIMGICACGDLNRSSIQRGLRFLLSTQKDDGSWDEPEITGTGFPGVFYLKYDMYRQNFPLLALATYVNYRKGFTSQPGFYQAAR
ncbi:MAG: squalene--hopene cyclase, partial [Verrucomicrobia bacterium]|nr:squalene--hopene cyclase [Verrucomicrobiota bacterium]